MTEKILAVIAAISILILSACGGQPTSRLPQNNSVSQSAIPSGSAASNLYFNPAIAERDRVWHFRDGFGHNMWIDLFTVPCAFGHCDTDVSGHGNIVVMHFTKDSCSAYWQPRTPAQCAKAVRLDELWFVLAEGYSGPNGWVHDGAWRSLGSSFIDYMGKHWKWEITYTTQPAPYTIVPATASYPESKNTFYLAIVSNDPSINLAADFTPLSGTPDTLLTWSTAPGSGSFSSLLTGAVPTLTSHQQENCVIEDWSFVSGFGLVQIAPLFEDDDSGTACRPIDPRFTMVRVN